MNSTRAGPSNLSARPMQVVDAITMQLYEQTMDAQEGVVYFLLEEMAQQRIKENLLAYTLLLSRGLPPFRLSPQAPATTHCLNVAMSVVLPVRNMVLRMGSQAVCAGAGAPLTQRQLDDACEAHLQQRFGEKLDFAVENSLPFIIHDGLVKETGDVRPHASWLHDLVNAA